MRLQEQGKTEQARKDLGNSSVVCKTFPPLKIKILGSSFVNRGLCFIIQKLVTLA